MSEMQFTPEPEKGPVGGSGGSDASRTEATIPVYFPSILGSADPLAILGEATLAGNVATIKLSDWGETVFKDLVMPGFMVVGMVIVPNAAKPGERIKEETGE